jgi:hypothetical protein
MELRVLGWGGVRQLAGDKILGLGCGWGAGARWRRRPGGLRWRSGAAVGVDRGWWGDKVALAPPAGGGCRRPGRRRRQGRRKEEEDGRSGGPRPTNRLIK